MKVYCQVIDFYLRTPCKGEHFDVKVRYPKTINLSTFVSRHNPYHPVTRDSLIATVDLNLFFPFYINMYSRLIDTCTFVHVVSNNLHH